MSDLAKQQFDKWLHEIVAKSTDGQRIQRRDCMTADQECMVFEGWQASRECLVIELPIPVDFPDGTGDYHQMIDPDDLIDAIHAAGVKTK